MNTNAFFICHFCEDFHVVKASLSVVKYLSGGISNICITLVSGKLPSRISCTHTVDATVSW